MNRWRKKTLPKKKAEGLAVRTSSIMNVLNRANDVFGDIPLVGGV